MELVTVAFGGVLLALFTGIQTWINKGRFDQIDERFERVEGRIDHVERPIDQLAAEIAQLRSDRLQVALASRAHPQTG